ncbi:Transcriptional regulator, TetR family [Actinomycetales bacterium JB111]|nr:Transcriptional regulator, TetR family [Actinomycetales bacterium JB111]
MGRTAGRTSEDTRRQILLAAARVLARRAGQASLDEIARAAGVSKGGLLYHFAGKDELFVALAMSLNSDFRARVQGVADGDSRGPGRLARAYIEVSFADGDDQDHSRDTIALAAQSMYVEELERLSLEDAARWRADLMADGLPEATVRLVVSSSDGANIGPLWGPVLTDADRAALKEQLVDLTIMADPAPTVSP